MWEELATTVIPRAVADGGNFLSTLFFGNRNNEWNKEAATTAYNRTLDLMNITRAYDTPAAQMQRFREAGLNPNLIYGQMQGGIQPPSAPQSAPSNMVAPQTEPIQLAQTRLLKAEAEAKEIENARKPELIDAELQKYASEAKLNNQQVHNLEIQYKETEQAIKNLQKQVEFLELQGINLGYQNRLAHEKTIGQMLENIYTDRSTETRLKLLASQLDISMAEAKLAYRSGLATVQLLTAQAYNQRQQGKLAYEQSQTEEYRRWDLSAHTSLLWAQGRTEEEQRWLVGTMTQYYYSATAEKDASAQFINLQREYERKWGGWQRGFGLFKTACEGFRDAAFGISALAVPGSGGLMGNMTLDYDGQGNLRGSTFHQPYHVGEKLNFPTRL